MKTRTILLTTVLLILMFTKLPAQNFWARDDFSGWDKPSHAIAGAMGFGLLKSFGVNDNDNLMISIGCAIGYEVKDYLIPASKYGWIGGDGFSWRDIVADVVGIGAMHLIYKAFEHNDRTQGERDWKRLQKLMEANR